MSISREWDHSWPSGATLPGRGMTFLVRLVALTCPDIFQRARPGRLIKTSGSTLPCFNVCRGGRSARDDERESQALVPEYY